MTTAPSFDLLTRDRCHLCESMRAVLDEVLPAFGLGYRLVYVDEHPDLESRFGDTVPVLLRDGKPVAKVRIDREQLVRIVRRRREAP